MPYISQKTRGVLYCGAPPDSVGELNYVITRLVDDFLIRSNGGVPSYTNINAVIGVLECAKQELYRRVAAPYEDKKRAENGDVYRIAP